MDEKVAEILAKKTVFKPVEKMEGSRVSEDYVGYLSYLQLTELAKRWSSASGTSLNNTV